MLTRERAEALLSLYWSDVELEIEEKIKAATMQLRTIAPEKLGLIQERIRTLEEVKGLPLQVINHHSPEEGDF